jgi:hypothetical protein
MANETELANIQTRTDELGDISSAALVQKVVAFPLVLSEDLPTSGNVKKFAKLGSVAGEVVSESSDLTIGATYEYTEGVASCTAAKYTSGCKFTVEAESFSDKSVEFMAAQVGAGIARDLDADICALASGFSNTVTPAGGVSTVEDILTAVYTIQNATKNVSDGRLIYLGNVKGVINFKKDIIKSSAAVWSQMGQTSILAGMTRPNGWQGELLGLIDVYQTSNMPTSGANDVNLVFDPMLAIVGIAGLAPKINIKAPEATGFFYEISGYYFAKFAEFNDEGGCGFLTLT